MFINSRNLSVIILLRQWRKVYGNSTEFQTWPWQNFQDMKLVKLPPMVRKKKIKKGKTNRLLRPAFRVFFPKLAKRVELVMKPWFLSQLTTSIFFSTCYSLKVISILILIFLILTQIQNGGHGHHEQLISEKIWCDLDIQCHIFWWLSSL